MVKQYVRQIRQPMIDASQCKATCTKENVGRATQY